MPHANRRLTGFLVVLILVIAVLFVGSHIYRNRDHREHFLEKKGELVRITDSLMTDTGDHLLFDVELENAEGIRLAALLKVPKPTSDPGVAYPVIVMLAGLRTGKKSLEFVKDPGNVILFALDYPYEGKVSKLGWWEFIVRLPAMRRAVLNTVPAVMLGVDYLCQRNDVDQTRIILAGGSIGALFAPAVGAADNRIAAVALLFGAGDLEAIFEANMNLPVGLGGPAAWLCGLITSPVEPLKYIERISPRPLLMINGSDDPKLPERCIKGLYERARQPKTIRWFPTGHVDIRSTEFHEKIREELVLWLGENDLVEADASRP
ncbi:MAG: alpha/beta hydrolase [Candidatus Latescibacterota bacterium]|nr:MAG: alpha/beta hydrolase [Candidatus Latescibacterota bacterium]